MTTTFYPTGGPQMGHTQAILESWLTTNPDIIDIIQHPDFAKVINPVYDSYHPCTVHSNHTVQIHADQLVCRWSRAAIQHAESLKKRLKELVNGYSIRYAGTDGNGGPTGRVQLYANGHWYSIKGLTHRNFDIIAKKAIQ